MFRRLQQLRDERNASDDVSAGSFLPVLTTSGTEALQGLDHRTPPAPGPGPPLTLHRLHSDSESGGGLQSVRDAASVRGPPADRDEEFQNLDCATLPLSGASRRSCMCEFGPDVLRPPSSCSPPGNNLQDSDNGAPPVLAAGEFEALQGLDHGTSPTPGPRPSLTWHRPHDESESQAGLQSARNADSGGRPTATQADAFQNRDTRMLPPPRARQRSTTCEFEPGVFRPLGSDGPWIPGNCPHSHSESQELQRVDSGSLLPVQMASEAEVLQSSDHGTPPAPGPRPSLTWHRPHSNSASEGGLHSARDAASSRRQIPDSAEEFQSLGQGTLPPGARQRSITCEFGPGVLRPLRSDGPWIPWNCPHGHSESQELPSVDSGSHLPVRVASEAEALQSLDDRTPAVPGDSDFDPEGSLHVDRDSDSVRRQTANYPEAPPAFDYETCEFRSGGFRPLRSDGPWIPLDFLHSHSESEELEGVDSGSLLPVPTASDPEFQEHGQDDDDELLLPIGGFEWEEIDIEDAVTEFGFPSVTDIGSQSSIASSMLSAGS